MLKFFANTNLFIAIAAVSITLGTGLRFGNIDHLLFYLLVVFLATLADYNWHRLVKVKLKTGEEVKNEWGTNHAGLILTLAIISSLLLLITFIQLPIPLIIWLIALGGITIYYSFPFHRFGWQRLDVRKKLGLKNLLIAFTWTMVTLYLPYLLSDKNESLTSLIFLFAERFLFIFAITIPFDMKDVNEDRKRGLKTLPIIYGNTVSLQITTVLLVLTMTISAIHFFVFDTDAGGIAGIITGIYTLFVLNINRLKQHELYYPVFLDGAILVSGLLLIAFEL